MSMIAGSFRISSICLFITAVYSFLPCGSAPTSPLPQMGVFLFVYGLCGAAVAVPALAFISFVVGSVVYVIRKRRVDSELAKSQAIVAATLSFVLLIFAGCALVAYWLRDLYIP
jgi:hypothetical protein